AQIPSLCWPWPHRDGSIRLVSGPDTCQGRVEIFYRGNWGTVCDDDWGLSDASVVCRQLGCGTALAATVLGSFGYGSGPVLLDNVGCGGGEARLADCFHLGWGQHNCGHHEDAGVICRGERAASPHPLHRIPAPGERQPPVRGARGDVLPVPVGHGVRRRLGPAGRQGGVQAAGLWPRPGSLGRGTLRPRHRLHLPGQPQVQGPRALAAALLPHPLGRPQLRPLRGCRCCL
uniref:SRCR domain-containing protein n=1 Tax=Catharus ustulatus TaxID=91951 RepID=A0A8C3UA38_CATUS